MHQQDNQTFILSNNISFKQSLPPLSKQLDDMKVIQIIGVDEAIQKALSIGQQLVNSQKAIYKRVTTQQIFISKQPKVAIIIKLQLDTSTQAQKTQQKSKNKYQEKHQGEQNKKKSYHKNYTSRNNT